MKKLKVDIGELEFAFDNASRETDCYLDLETGRVVTISDSDRYYLESLLEEVYDPAVDQRVDLTEHIMNSDLPDWHKQTLLEADRIEMGYGTRYIGVPTADSHEGYRDMEAFIVTVEEDGLRDRLWRAISGRGAFRYFKDVLLDYPRERQRWFDFKDQRTEERILDWLRSQGIESIIERPPAEELPPPIPIRTRLFNEVLFFVRKARQLPGVMRIALIGSLATEKPNPKDADLLVWVADEMDLAPLAKLGRQIQGHAQGFNRGADVFLVDPRGRYLGRTCPWKRCGPGIRISCDALHCGRRPYLHDDLGAIQLSGELIAAPAVDLWPKIQARVPIPQDVERDLLAVLRDE